MPWLSASTLEFHVPGLFEVAFHVDLFVPERSQRLGLGDGDGIEQGGLAVHHPHAAPTAAARGLDDDRVAYFPGAPGILFVVVRQGTVGTGDARHTGLPHGADGGNLVAHQLDGFRLRADKDEPAFLHTLGEAGVLGQESVAGVNGHRVGHFGGGNHRGHVQVTVGGRRRADADGFIRQQHVLERGIRGGVRRNGLDPQFPARPEDTQGNFAPVSD